jgi:hypothetical protein
MKSSVLMAIGALLALIILTAAACMTSIAPPAKGHEETLRPTVIVPPKGTVTAVGKPVVGKPEAASRPAADRDLNRAEAGPQDRVPDHCRSAEESAAEVRNVDESAARYRGPLTGAPAAEFVRDHVPDAPAGVDEVTVYSGYGLGDNTIAVLAARGCVLAVRVTTLKVPE